MANTQVGVANITLASGQVVGFDGFASLIAQGSTAAGVALVRGASQTFPRAASLYDAHGDFQWDQMVFRFEGAGSARWSAVGTPNASVGMAIYSGDGRPIVLPAHVQKFQIAALAGGSLSAIFLQGDDVDL